MSVLEENEVYVNVLLDSDTAIDFSKNTGLKSTRLSTKYTINIDKPSFGLISQEGTLSVFDFDGSIQQNL